MRQTKVGFELDTSWPHHYHLNKI